jgi:hypothetical protein
MMLEPPTAVHVDALMQLIDARVVDPAGVPMSFQTEPPLVVPMTWGPVARHVESVEHEIPVREVAAAGGVWGTQVAPPLTVDRITPFGPPVDVPTAVQ